MTTSPHSSRDKFLQTQRIAFLRRRARLDLGKSARLDEPLLPRRKLPASLHGKARIPAHRRVLDVHHLIMRIEQFDAVAVRIAQIDEQRVARAMSAGPELDVGGKA